MIDTLQSVLGIFALSGLAWLLSENRAAVRLRILAAGIGLQLLLGVLILKLPATRAFFLSLNTLVLGLQQASEAGTAFVFGYLGGGPLPFTLTEPANGFVLAFRALPLLLVVSALSSLLFYWRLLPLVIRGISWVLERTLGIGGALGLSTAANVFVGMTEAPLLIRPYLRLLSRSELFALMTAGMATIAGTMMVLYAQILGPVIPDAMGHILIASLLSAPAALTIALVMVPETAGRIPTGGRDIISEATSSMDAVTQGTLDGLKLYLNILAMLVVLIALVHLANQLLGMLPDLNGAPLSLQRLLGWLMAPLVWLTGIPWSEAQLAGSLMGVKTILNEFIAYIDLSRLEPGLLSERSRLILVYSLCGFANLGSLGIMIGGLGVMAPERRNEIVELGLRSILSGTLATLMTGAVYGVLS